ncbi:unnamed protein product [Spirodela intermedia]|uniref:Uncharacterized protein n=1 Tax=Spirodela intermedia TaxID=51605 RepID=A0A7I8JMG2_SPIIN|nr:unnamed protein product [Spirodela intermedia]CAA6671290.1 unnamed protein product [Spirodela intermedia]
MSRTAPVEIIGGEAQPPPCDVTHTAPAVIFSTGGYAGNFFHDVSEVLIPLFLTAGQLRHVQLVASDYQYYWVAKYRRVLDHLAGSPEQAASWRRPRRRPPSSPRCTAFPRRWWVSSTTATSPATPPRHPVASPSTTSALPPGGAVPLPPYSQSAARQDQRRPLLVLLSRRNSRALLNEAAVAELAREVGFRVEVAGPEALNRLEAGRWCCRWCRGGCSGRPWRTSSGRRRRWGCSTWSTRWRWRRATLSEDYPPDHPVLADPWAIDRLGYNVSGPVYTTARRYA